MDMLEFHNIKICDNLKILKYDIIFKKILPKIIASNTEILLSIIIKLNAYTIINSNQTDKISINH